MTADWWPYTPCRCESCMARKLAPGTVCRDPECQPGPGLPKVTSRLDRALGTLVKITQTDYCVSCQKMVTVTARKNGAGTGWVYVCENDHTWSTYN